ncbi:hypothetical protein [Vallitalea okinawensis]|uniref:hypothetical protein n=1 Tax=Vallitalea okinawensis TaxID=2078660 RepID=UPI000CFD4FD9|nr:hypothetical protein [Vallitalea okinawensis]
MSLKHEFLLSSGDRRVDGGLMTLEYRDAIPTECKLVIQDEFVRYITDLLMWVPTYNPDKDEDGYGLNYWGNTIIDKLGCDKLITIMQGWKLIMEVAPRKINLKGGFCWNEEMEKGYYKTLEFDKIILLETINKLILFGEKVKKSNYLNYHMGI